MPSSIKSARDSGSDTKKTKSRIQNATLNRHLTPGGRGTPVTSSGNRAKAAWSIGHRSWPRSSDGSSREKESTLQSWSTKDLTRNRLLPTHQRPSKRENQVRRARAPIAENLRATSQTRTRSKPAKPRVSTTRASCASTSPIGGGHSSLSMSSTLMLCWTACLRRTARWMATESSSRCSR